MATNKKRRARSRKRISKQSRKSGVDADRQVQRIDRAGEQMQSSADTKSRPAERTAEKTLSRWDIFVRLGLLASALATGFFVYSEYDSFLFRREDKARASIETERATRSAELSSISEAVYSEVLESESENEVARPKLSRALQNRLVKFTSAATAYFPRRYTELGTQHLFRFSPEREEIFRTLVHSGIIASQQQPRTASIWYRCNFDRMLVDGLQIRDAELMGLKFDSVALRRSVIYESWIEFGDLSRANLSESRIQNCSFDFTRFQHLTFDGTVFENVSFRESGFVRSTFDNCRLRNVNFYSARIPDSTFHRSTIENVRFTSSCVLPPATAFEGAQIENLDLTQAICRSSDWLVELSKFARVDPGELSRWELIPVREWQLGQTYSSSKESDSKKSDKSGSVARLVTSEANELAKELYYFRPAESDLPPDIALARLDGEYRFDGYEFSRRVNSMMLPESLQGVHVTDITEDRERVTWGPQLKKPSLR